MSDQILPLRFKLNQEKLKDFRVYVLPFAWRKPFEELIIAVANASHNKSTKIWPPFRQLNTVLSALIPSLIQPFEGSGYNRPLMIFDREARPTVNQIYYVVREWALLWAKDFLQQRKINQPTWIPEFQRKLDRVQVNWESYNLWDLWMNSGEQDRLKFKAIPSLLASLLHQQNCMVGTRPITWQLVQDRGNKVCAMSEPQTSTPNEKKIGTFSYLLEFAVQTQAGHKLPSDAWINLFVHCRRFLDHKIKHADPRSLHTMLVKTNDPRLDQWPVSRAYTSLGMIIRKSGGYVEWEEKAANLFNHLRMHNPLEDPQIVLQDPKRYMNLDDLQKDIYLAVYREGMGPAHKLKSGFSPQERKNTTDAVSSLLSEFLIPGGALERDSFYLSQQAKSRPAILQPPRHLESHHSILACAKENRKQKRSPRLAKQVAREWEAITRQRLLDRKTLHLMLCYRESQKDTKTRDMLKEHMRTIYGISATDNWPEGLLVTEHEIPEPLEQPLHDEGKSPYGDKQAREEWSEQIEKEWELKKRTWQEQIAQWVEPTELSPATQNAYRVALVEMSDQTNKYVLHQDRQIKGAVRAAFYSHNISSQMILSLPNKAKKYKAIARNAAMELLLRHTGLLYGSLEELCEETQCGISSQLASELTIIGLYRNRDGKTKWRKRNIDVDFPMAVRVRPGSIVEARFPGLNKWQPYLSAGVELGKHFSQTRQVELKSDGLTQFLWEILTENADRPTLVLLTADDWRWPIYPQLQDKSLKPNHIELPFSLPGYSAITPETHPCLRVVRVRDRGNLGEVPDFVRNVGSADGKLSRVDFVHDLSLYEDSFAPNAIRTFLSIGKHAGTLKNLTADALKHQEGGDIASKQQIPLEIVPFFLPPGDDPLAWARLTHSLRDMCPWWPAETLKYPHPIHMAAKAVEDALWALGPKPEDLGVDV